MSNIHNASVFENDNYPIVTVAIESRKKQQQDVFSRILPMLATPFIMQTTFLPLVLISMKFMLMNSLFIGKLAIVLWIVNLIRQRYTEEGGFYSHNVNIKHNSHPGHHHDMKFQRYSAHYELGDNK
ncbi:hypothetical protein NQ317_003682 [Molorchus minor]|uniref:Uncharacterized protein n=1 Tax=Molorchus minor TaxID=1323400 RepID=A0ABQ9JRQ0_9CUCU|nr:hypothetical protein NQ317_003682 [Molorchus minor]